MRSHEVMPPLIARSSSTMTDFMKDASSQAQPPLPELLARYLQRQQEALVSGLDPTGAAGEVVPFEAGPAQPIEPRLAWKEAIMALQLLHPEGTKSPEKPPSD